MSSVLTALTRTPPGPGILSGKVSKGGKQLSPGGRCEASTCCGPLGGQRLCLAVPLRGDSQQLLSSGDFSCRQDTVTEWTVSLLSCTCQWGDRTQKCFGEGQTGTVTGSEALHPRPQPPHSAPSLASLVVSLQPPWAARPPPSAPPPSSLLSLLSRSDVSPDGPSPPDLCPLPAPKLPGHHHQDLHTAPPSSISRPLFHLQPVPLGITSSSWEYSPRLASRTHCQPGAPPQALCYFLLSFQTSTCHCSPGPSAPLLSQPHWFPCRSQLVSWV